MNLNTLQWNRLNNEQTPPDISDHTFVAINDQLYIFGGQGQGHDNKSSYKFDINEKPAQWIKLKGNFENISRQKACQFTKL